MLDLNYFELFGISPGVVLDEDELAKRARALKIKFHPDHFVNALVSEQSYALQISAQLETALNVLSSPTERVRYLLERGGFSYVPEQDGKLSAEFLMQQMERKAHITEWVSSRQDVREELQVLQQRVRQEFGEVFDEIVQHEAALLGQIPIKPVLTEICENLSRLMFLDRLCDEIKGHLKHQALTS